MSITGGRRSKSLEEGQSNGPEWRYYCRASDDATMDGEGLGLRLQGADADEGTVVRYGVD